MKRLTPDAGFVETRENGPQIYGTAWPLAENYYLCVYDRGGGNYGIYLIDAFGNRELLYRDPEIACLGPVPLKPRPVPPRIPAVGEPTRLVDSPTYDEVGAEHALDPNSPGMSGMGVVGVVNVYDSLHPFPEDAKIETLRIVQVLPKSTFNHHKPQIGYGCETGARAVLGTVPVESDGSAHFYLPAAKDVFFQAIDNRGLAVQSMRSATYVHAGEKLVCAGCHERSQRPGGLAHAPLDGMQAEGAVRDVRHAQVLAGRQQVLEAHVQRGRRGGSGTAGTRRRSSCRRRSSGAGRCGTGRCRRNRRKGVARTSARLAPVSSMRSSGEM